MKSNLRVALLGNPNTGKSSLFNALTGLKQKIGNFPGVTVEKKLGYFKLPNQQVAELIDLPGTYSLYPKSADEEIPYKYLLSEDPNLRPQVVVFVADASNLKRNLVLLTQAIDIKIPVILVLNMIDQAKAKGIDIDIPVLQEELGVPIVSMNARKGQGINTLLEYLAEEVPVSQKNFQKTSVANSQLTQVGENTEVEEITNIPSYTSLLKDINQGKIPNAGIVQKEDILHRYKHINTLLNKSVTVEEGNTFKKGQDKLDNILTHKVWGYVIFLGILFIIFQAIFNLADKPMELIDQGFGYLSQSLSRILPPGILNDLLTNGILAGLSGVVVFIPQIAFLFFFISLMEDTGYLARVAFMMDRSMRRFGLNGKSVIPLISGTACAVPAIMATRNIENPKSRLITILVTPLMSCSARLPVYILLIGIVVPKKTLLQLFGLPAFSINLQGLSLMGLYLLGFVAMLGSAAVYHIILKTKAKQYFIMEMPVYRFPNWRNVVMTVYKKVYTFVTEAGKIIVAISIVLWFLASFGPKSATTSPTATNNEVTKVNTNEKVSEITETKEALQLEHSYAGYLGKAIEPVLRPLGFDWKISIAIITSFAAREVFVGTMTTLYGLEGEGSTLSQLKENLKTARDPQTGKLVYTFATVISLLIFYVFAMQCMSTLAVTYKETASLKWTFIQFFSMTGLAYISSLVLYQLLK